MSVGADEATPPDRIIESPGEERPRILFGGQIVDPHKVPFAHGPGQRNTWPELMTCESVSNGTKGARSRFRKTWTPPESWGP